MEKCLKKFCLGMTLVGWFVGLLMTFLVFYFNYKNYEYPIRICTIVIIISVALAIIAQRKAFDYIYEIKIKYHLPTIRHWLISFKSVRITLDIIYFLTWGASILLIVTGFIFKNYTYAEIEVFGKRALILIAIFYLYVYIRFPENPEED